MPKGVKLEIQVGELVQHSVVSERFYKKLVDLVATRPWALSQLFEIGVTAADAGEALRKGSKIGGITVADASANMAKVAKLIKKDEDEKRKRTKKGPAR
jgi:hypothetical protein